MAESKDHEEILRTLGRIEGTLVEISTLPKRVRSLELARSYIIGGGAAIGSLLLVIELILKVTDASAK